MINPYTIFIVLLIITMLMNLANIFLAIVVVKRHQECLLQVKGKHVFNPFNQHSLTIWFVVFSIFVSVLSFMVNAENILTLNQISIERLLYGIKFRIVDILSTVSLLQYHILLLLNKKND